MPVADTPSRGYLILKKIIPPCIRKNTYLRALAKILFARYFYKLAGLRPCKVAICPVPRKKPRLWVDVSVICEKDHKTGIQRVTKNIFGALREEYSAHMEITPVWSSIRARGYFHAQASRTGNDWYFTRSDHPMLPARGDVFLGLDFAPAIVLAQLPFLKMLKKNGLSIFFILHDLIPLTHSACFPAGTCSLHKSWLLEIVKMAGIICVSQSVQAQTRAWLHKHCRKFYGNNIYWAHNGYEKENFNKASGESKKSISPMPYFLMVGTVEPRKGHAQALRAFESLWKGGLNMQLVFVGRQGWKVERLCRQIRSHPEFGKKLLWLDNCGDEMLGLAYDGAACLLAPSTAEGFGLPVIEAAARGVPLILRDLPVFQEIAGIHAFYFHGETPGDLARAISSWLKLYKLNRHPLPAGIKIQTWRESASAIFEIIQPTGIKEASGTKKP